MEKRSSKRIVANFDAEFICKGKNYPVYVENMSESGLHIITASQKHISSLIPETTGELKLKSRTGKKANLKCEIKWVHINKTPIHGLTYRLGSEIVSRHPQYLEFYKGLH